MAVETGVKLPNIIHGPLTLEEKRIAVEKQSWRVVSDFQIKSLSRNWSPSKDLPLYEMADQGLKLSEESVDIIEGFMGIEGHVGDYAKEGIIGLGDSPARLTLHLQWAAEEARHWQTLGLVLIHAGLRTPEEVFDYNSQLTKKAWHPSQHKGLDNSIGGTIYGAFQERGTYTNYIKEHQRVRNECGLPERVTPEERLRKMQYGILEAFRRIELDEIAHHGIYLKLGKINLTYYPEETLQSIKDIYEGFKMPALRLIPGAGKFIRALLKTNVYNEEIDLRLSRIPVLNYFGFENIRDLEEVISNPDTLKGDEN